MKKLEDYVISIPDFPKEGIIFRDVTGVLEDADGYAMAIEAYKEILDKVDFDVIVGAEARGFVFAAALAYIYHKPVILARKPGKLPRKTISEEYDLEYGSACLEMHTDSIKPGQKAVVIDDLIATGGTVKAACKLIEKLGGTVVKCAFLMELAGLNGRAALEGYDVESAIVYPGK